MTSHTRPSSSSTLFNLLKSQGADEALVVPGIYDGLTARLAHSLNFPALYLPSGGVAMSKAGLPALGLITSTEMAEQARTLINLKRQIPMIVDADNGYGPPLNVARTVALYIEAGVAAIHINDKLVDQRKGFRDGKNICPKEEFLARMRAAVLTRQKMFSDILIIAESAALRYVGLEDAIDRLKSAAEVGAEMVFPQGMMDREESEAFGNAFKDSAAFLVCGIVQGSRGGYKVTAAEAKAMGYSMVLYAGVCASPAFMAMKTALENLKANGDCDEVPPEASARQMFDIFGMSRLLEFDKEIA